MVTTSRKKIWCASSCFADHKSVAASIPKIFDAYVGKNSVPPVMNESIMLAVNAVNDCPYCAGLHGQLARMAGVEKTQEMLSACEKTQVADCAEQAHQAAVTYAYSFGERNGRGEEEASAFEELQTVYGASQASSIRALCWFLLWGSLGGNTINAFLFGRVCCAPAQSSSLLFELIFFIYYGPLFLVIAILMKLLKFAPRIPACLSATMGFVLTTCASIWILPVALLATICTPLCGKTLSYAYARDLQPEPSYRLLADGS